MSLSGKSRNYPESLTVTSPEALDSSLVFQVYAGPFPIGYARLRATPAARRKSVGEKVRVEDVRDKKETSAPGVSYCLKMIEVNPAYRNQGVGSTLLQEVISFCRDQRVSRLYGEARGETELLRRWYRENGFELGAVDTIDLRLT